MNTLPVFSPSLEVTIFDWSIVIILFVLDFAVRVWLLIYIPKNRKPTAATAWLLLIVLVPFFDALENATRRGVAVHVLFDAYGSRKISLTTWRKRSTWRSFLDSVARLTSALQ